VPTQTKDIFGITTDVRPDAYVDRGGLDEKLRRQLGRNKHVALRGSSKSGKSWLRQRILPDAIVVQCRYNHTVVDLYRLALNELGLSLEVSTTANRGFEGSITGESEIGVNLVGKLRAKLGLTASKSESVTSAPAIAAIHDLGVIADLIKMSGRRLVIEDFHYLPVAERKWLASDLKALWEKKLFVIIIGVWSSHNMLLNLNSELSGRFKEVPIGWTPAELAKVIYQGADDLNLRFDPTIVDRLTTDCYGNVGILQSLALEMLDELGIYEAPSELTAVSDHDALDAAAMEYSDQLVPVFQTFASNVASGIRKRNNTTAIYAHAMAAVLEQKDKKLLKGVPLDTIYQLAHSREERIQKGNLKAALGNIESLQVDDEERGLVLAYNPTNSEVTVVNRDLLFYRKYQTVAWPWEDLIREGREADGDTTPTPVAES
jgi:hypothetical protein